MNHDRRPICVRLSPAQVDEVVRAAAGGRTPSLSTLVSKLLAAPIDRDPAADDPQAAQRGLSRKMAGARGRRPSPADRYAVTLVALGLLERCPESRKYRLPAT